MHRVIRHDETHADTARQLLVQPVEQRAATGEVNAALVNVGGDVGWQILQRALDEFGQRLDRLGKRFGDVLRPQNCALRSPMPRVAAANVDLGIHRARLRDGAARFDLDALGIAFADQQLMGLADIAHDRLVHGVTGDAQRAGLHHVTERQHRNITRAAADIDDHGATLAIDGKASAERCRDGFLDQIDLARTG